MSQQDLKYEAYFVAGHPAPHRDPVQVLMDEHDPLERSRAHLQLGVRAASRAEVGRAVWHFREAIDLDPTDEVPKEQLRRLGEPASPPSAAPKPVRRRNSLWSRLTERLARRPS